MEMLPGIFVEVKREDKYLAKHLERIQTVLASQLEIHFSKYYFCGPDRRYRVIMFLVF